MKEYTRKDPATVAGAGAGTIDALGGVFDCRWDDGTPLSTNAHNALVSAFLKTGGVFDHLVETCPLRLRSPNATSNRETLGTAMAGMLNGARRYRHFDSLCGDAVTAEVFGLRRLMSCDSVRRNLGAIPLKEGLEWIWGENLRLVEPLLDQDYIIDLDPTVKPLYGRQEGAEFGYNPHKPGRPSHCYHTLCIAELRLVLGVVVHAGGETAGFHSVGMLDMFLKSPSTAGAWRDAVAGWQCSEAAIALGTWSRRRRVLLVRRPVERKPRRRKDPPRREVHELPPGLELVTSEDAEYADGYEWHALVTDLGLDARAVSQLYRDRGNCKNIFAEISNVLAKMASASQLRHEERWQRLLYYAFRKYPLVQRLYPPLMDGQIMPPLA